MSNSSHAKLKDGETLADDFLEKKKKPFAISLLRTEKVHWDIATHLCKAKLTGFTYIKECYREYLWQK